ncbi:14600_t:CDS:2, partial [Cetraspora pellucida]
MNEHWSTNCTGNAYCDISFEDYMELKNKPETELTNSFYEKKAIRRYELWMQNAVKRVKHAKEDSTDAVPKRMSDCNYYRNLWWEKGEFNEKAKWEEVTLPYVLAKGIAIDDYEERVEKFNIHRCWEWLDGVVLIYELPSMPHEVCISAIVKQINRQCGNADGTDAEIHGAGSTKADASFRPKKPSVTAPNGSNGDNRPWPNLVVEQQDPLAPPIQPQTLLSDPIPLDFFFVQRAIRE